MSTSLHFPRKTPIPNSNMKRKTIHVFLENQSTSHLPIGLFSSCFALRVCFRALCSNTWWPTIVVFQPVCDLGTSLLLFPFLVHFDCLCCVDAVRREPGSAAPIPRREDPQMPSSTTTGYLPNAVRLEPVTVRGRPLATGDRVRGATVATPPLRKLLFSATLTSNPQKLAGLDVVNPIIYTAR